MLMRLQAVHTTALLLFLGLAAGYICLSPGSIAGQGYTGEEIDSGLRMLEVATARTEGPHRTTNGLVAPWPGARPV